MNLIIGIAGFAGSNISNFTISYFSRRGVLIGGHFFMMVFHFLIFLFIIYKEMNLMLVSMALFDLTFAKINLYTGANNLRSGAYPAAIIMPAR
jgi:predicted MFS family arabinose efflux permease